MKYNKFLILLVPLFTFLFLEIYFFFPKLVFIILVLLFSLIFFIARQFIAASERKDNIINVVSLPLLFVFGSVFVSFFMSKPIVHLLFVADSVFLYFYFKILYFYFIRFDLFQKNKLENLSAYGNLVIFYFMAVSFYGLQLFINIAIWKLFLFLALVVFLIVLQTSWVGEIEKKVSIFYGLLLSLIVLELAWGIAFLTLSYYILGLLLTISFYVLIGLMRFYLFGNLNKNKVQLYLVFGLLSVFMALLTARWI